MNVLTRELLKKLKDAQQHGAYAETMFSDIDAWFSRMQRIRLIPETVTLESMAGFLEKGRNIPEAWNDPECNLARYFADAVRCHNLTTTLQSLRQI